MALPYELLIGLRYTRAKRRNHFISFISLISMLGIALGVTALIVVLSVMNGFQTELRGRILAVVSHVQISGASGEMADWPHVAEQSSKQPGVVGAAPYVQAQGMLSFGQSVRGAMVRGIVPDLEDKVADFRSHMKEGQLDSLAPDSFNIVLGQELALWLGADVGDSVVVMLADERITAVGAMPSLKRFKVSGIFEAGYNEIDKGLAVVNMSDLQRVLKMGDGVTGVRLKLHDMEQSWDVARTLAENLQGPYRISDWTSENANLYHSLKMEKTVMGILLSLIIAMGAFNLVSSQVMLVTDKQADIAILRTLGLTPGGVMQVFMVQGTVIGVIGTVLGLIGGIALTLNLERILDGIEALFNVTLLPEDVYYITGLPTDMQADDVVKTLVVALALSFLATLYPAWRAARTQPAEALRYE